MSFEKSAEVGALHTCTFPCVFTRAEAQRGCELAGQATLLRLALSSTSCIVWRLGFECPRTMKIFRLRLHREPRIGPIRTAVQSANFCVDCEPEFARRVALAPHASAEACSSDTIRQSIHSVIFLLAHFGISHHMYGGSASVRTGGPNRVIATAPTNHQRKRMAAAFAVSAHGDDIQKVFAQRAASGTDTHRGAQGEFRF